MFHISVAFYVDIDDVPASLDEAASLIILGRVLAFFFY
jgi:hypothetical protein